VQVSWSPDALHGTAAPVDALTTLSPHGPPAAASSAADGLTVNVTGPEAPLTVNAEPVGKLLTVVPGVVAVNSEVVPELVVPPPPQLFTGGALDPPQTGTEPALNSGVLAVPEAPAHNDAVTPSTVAFAVAPPF
jgi:hypothetical protein